GHDRTGASRAADVLFAGRQRFVNSKRGHPSDVAGICVNRPQLCPGWFLARSIAQHAAVLIPNRRSKAVIRTGTIDAAAIVRLRGSIPTAVIAVRPLLLHPTAQRCIVRLNEYVAKFRVCRHAAPVWTAVPRKDDRAARRRAFLMEKERREWP